MNAACRPGLLATFLLAVALSGPALGDDRADVQAALVRGRKLREDGKYAEAAASYEKARALIPSVFGADSMNMVGIRALLAECYQKMGEYPKAESLYKQALAGNEAMPGGKDHPFTAETLMNLASLHREQSQYAKAEPLYQRALAILEAKLGKDHPYTATALDRLAVIYWDMGQSAKAEPLLQRAAAIKEAKLGKDDPETARTLNNLACFYKDTGRHAKAEPLFLRVLAIDEAKLGKDHPDTAGALANLALVYRETGDYAKAEPPLRRALAIFAARLGKDHPDTARAAGNMANLVGDMGQHARAEPLHRWALESRETKLGKDHPHTAQTLSNLANLHASLGEWDTSAGFRDRNRRAARNYVANTLPILSDREQEQFLATQDEVAFHTALSHGLLRRDHPAESALSAGWVLNGKAVAGQVRAEGILLARESRDPRTGPIAAELTATRQALAALALQSPAEGGAEARAGKLADLAAKEQDLARRLTQLTGRPANAAWVELADVRKALAPSAVLVEIARFDRKKLDWKPGDKFSLGPRYAAWVIPPTGAVRVIDLGEAGPIDAAVKAARTELEASARTIRAEGEPAAEARLRKPLERLAKLVLHPLLPHIGEAETWVVSPDSNLWLVPWAALPLPGGAYAVEKHTVTYLVTGRDLLAAKNGKVRPTAPVVLADPDFDLTSSEAAAITRRLVRDSVDGPRGLPRRFKLGGVARLPGTAMEAAAIAPRLRQYTGLEPRVWTDKQALAGVFKAAKNPRVVVLSTHGFFLEDDKTERKDDGRGGPFADGRPPAGPAAENPLLRCGPLLAGCNHAGSAGPGADTGVLTGLEIVGTDLRGTELVVLSACETGLGDVRNGEGVAGLRQAFQLAGAESVVATLWQVPDRESALLAAAFFDGLTRGRSRDAALAEAQRSAVVRRRDRAGAAHPFFWAAYTLTGQTR